MFVASDSVLVHSWKSRMARILMLMHWCLPSAMMKKEHLLSVEL